MGLFSKLKEGLTKTRQGFVAKIETLVSGGKKIDEELYEEIEELLIQADVGVNTAVELVEDLRKAVKERKVDDAAELRNILKELIADIMGEEQAGLSLRSKPAVIVVVGVNGVGKTTTIGKLAHNFREEGRKVLLAAGDTFRAAAIDQLQIWAGRVGCDIIKHSEGADTAAVVFDAIQAAKARDIDVLIVDTAGRLHTKANLMEELKKLFRVISRELPDSPDEVLLVLDATTGQNAISQAKIFGEASGVTGIVLTKLDGTAKGGVVIGIKTELNIPVKYVGVGEKIDDLREFDPKEFVEALFGD
ncbi:signal recognition particle-docking protein FtsY [Phosphitispora fastidiosa]|uniref:signal recognition particle-docking protein FtsY n=1 Tax=Phosphitispora fastidiosa TaxID=2837202 RepID=UPI001E45B87E|nr:signal recognition particle-docking protein FtsY [Phosphitispora fastidiosa]MBU7005469.1 fused signal recognition particle receptor [Phosphitispora fastidiosa]